MHPTARCPKDSTPLHSGLMFDSHFIDLLERSLGKEPASVVLGALEQEPGVSIRLNPAKLRDCPFVDAVPVEWSPYGYILKERPSFTTDPLFHAGCYYVQDSSAMFVGEVFRRVLEGFGPGVQVLDLCAAPGGKTTDLSASLRERFGDSFRLLANELVPKRFHILRSNVAVWGDPNTAVVSRDPSTFGDSPLFDIVLADVPCSGEGMFRKDGEARAQWSLENVEFCASRQKKILSDIWPVLRPGGILVYSTCTFNHFENDDAGSFIEESLGGERMDIGPVPSSVFRTGYGYAMLPGMVPGEGQWVAAFRKEGTPDGIPAPDAAKLFRAVFPASPVPDHPHVDVDLRTALAYLHGEALRLKDAPIGLVNICYEGQVLGQAKNIGSRCNNLYPKDRRIRMDV